MAVCFHIFSIQHAVQRGSLTPEDLKLRVTVHYGIPSTASILAFDSIQRLLALATLDGRIKVIGGGGIEGLLMSPNQLPYKYLEFITNQGYLVSISNDNEIQVWSLDSRSIACCLQWESNITAFSIVGGSHFMYVGDENGLMSVVKFDPEDEKLMLLPYRISAASISAYANGLFLLWDISRGQVLFVGGGKDLQLNDELDEPSSRVDDNVPFDALENSLSEKEISALCWASSNGSILAVGYVDGDILFWKTSITASGRDQQGSPSSKNIVRLQLSSSEKRLPVIVLHWSGNSRAPNNCDGQLFIYGGDEIGSEEVLTVLTIEWSPGLEVLRCVGRTELKLHGSFADMILLSSPGAAGDDPKVDLFVLTNPGKLHFYDKTTMSAIIGKSKTDSKSPISPLKFPAMIPTAEPSITTSKLIKLPIGGFSTKILSELASMKLSSTEIQGTSANWPLTGGVPYQLPTMKDDKVERVYIAGYRDGSIRILDATHPVFSFICHLNGELEGIKVAGLSAPVLKLDFCCATTSLAVGNECGLVRVYDLKGGAHEKNFHFVTDSRREVHTLPQGKGPHCRAVFSLLNSPVQALQFSKCGVKLGVGYGSGRIAVLDVSSSSVLLFTEAISNSSFPIITMIWKEHSAATHGPLKSPRHSGAKSAINYSEESLFILTKDAKINVFDEGGLSVSGSPDEKHTQESSQNTTTKSESNPGSGSTGSNLHESQHHSSAEETRSAEKFLDSYVLLCCQDSLRLYSVNSIIQGNNKPTRKVKQSKCCWTTIFKSKERDFGLVVLFQSGVIEIRSLPDLELLKESSLQSILMWNFKANMDKISSSSEEGQIVLANGDEVAFLSVLSNENELRIPDSLPSLHDKVLAAAADAAFSVSYYQKKNQLPSAGILGSIVKGFRGGKMTPTMDFCSTRESYCAHLEKLFSKTPFSDSSFPALKNAEQVEELTIDDIEIDDEPPAAASTSSEEVKEEKRTERQRLFGDGNDDWKPRPRTTEEILTTYKFSGDASLAAAHAKNKLLERQEKLEVRIELLHA
uniref:Nucleotide binding protein n=1 Tax=Cucumis melo TaxID=3656 RepID=A0A9I9CVE7_CUCME